MRQLHSFPARLLGLACLAPAANAQLEVQLFTGAVTQPTSLTSPVGDTQRVFITTQSGRIRLYKNGVPVVMDFLNIDPLVLDGGERGLLGLAFHPLYATNRKFYVSYTDNSGASVVRQYLRSSSTLDQADAASGTVVFGPLVQPFADNNGGCIQFGGDGKLYLGLGDGGGANGPGELAQDQLSPFGKMLRFDVDLPFPHVPLDNPYVGGDPADDLTWSKGFRNPWRFSFDRATGDLWIGDVGENSYEEVDFEPAGAGGRNYGWDCMEGNACTGEGPAGGSCTCNAVSLVDPVHVYDHGQGCSITGGIRYRGSLMPNHVGRYFFADYCTGNVYSFQWNGSVVSDLRNHTLDLGISGTENISAFGEDANGELYLCDMNGGSVWLVREDCTAFISNHCVTSPNSNGPGAWIEASGMASVDSDDFTLGVRLAAVQQPGIFYYGTHMNQAPFGNGWRCIGGPTFRLPVVVTDIFGDAEHVLDFDAPPANAGTGEIFEGSTWHFQFWFRDPLAGGEQFDLSDGLTVYFCL